MRYIKGAFVYNSVADVYVDRFRDWNNRVGQAMIGDRTS